MLTTIDTFKQWQDAANPLPSSYDGEIARLLASVTEEIEAFTFARFTPTVLTERRDGNGRDSLALIRRPVTEVVEVIVGANTLPLASGLTDMGALVEPWGVRLRGYLFTKGRQNCSITYRAGFATVPKLVEEACLERRSTSGDAVRTSASRRSRPARPRRPSGRCS